MNHYSITLIRACANDHPLSPETCTRCRGFVPKKRPKGVRHTGLQSRFLRSQRKCLYLGPATGEERPLLNCAKDPPTTAPLRACLIHGVCTEEVGVRGKPQVCRYCSDDTRKKPPPRPPIKTRHLIYHLLPVTGRWKDVVRQILSRWDLFNGRKIIAVATGGPSQRIHGGNANATFSLDTIEEVKKFLPRDAELIEVRNDPNWREVLTFHPLFSAVSKDVDPTTATLYAHAKGVTQPPGASVHHWTEVLHETCLDYWPLVDELLSRYPIAGSFYKHGHGWNESASDWHYSGSWFWFRNQELFHQQDWRRIDQFWGGIESYPSLRFEPREAGVIFYRGSVGPTNLYDWGLWNNEIDPALQRWREENVSRRAGVPLSLNLGCGPFRAEGWVNADVTDGPDVHPDVIVQSGQPLPWPDGHFSRVFLGHVLEHVAWDALPVMLAEVRRVLRPGGSVCVVGPDYKKAVGMLIEGKVDMKVLDLIVEDDLHHQAHAEPGPAARHQWNAYAERVERALSAAGFVNVRSVEFVPELLKSWPVVDFSNLTQSAQLAEAP